MDKLDSTLTVYELFFQINLGLGASGDVDYAGRAVWNHLIFGLFLCIVIYLFISLFKASPLRLQLFKRMLQCCFAAEISPGYPSAWDHQQLFL